MIRMRCPGCRREARGGLAECQATFDELLAREIGEPSSPAMHRLMLDLYALQHPEHYCTTARSCIEHLTGLLVAIEHDSRPELLRAVHGWLESSAPLERPLLPERRGALTIASVIEAPNRVALEHAIRAWAASVWEAYAPLHALAREWTAEAFAGK